MNDVWEVVEKLILNYVESVRLELDDRWKQWRLDLMQPEIHEVIGALLARQVTLATQLARSPGIWNAHIAPMILRAMTDVHITLAWILKNPLERSRQFILYGLGQEKLLLEHRKAALTAEGKDTANDPMIKAAEASLNAQRFGFLTEVNVGSWSEVSVMKMAEEADCLDLYRYAYTPFSAVTHSMWHHVNGLNLQFCENPLHRYHKIPIDKELRSDPDYLYRAAKYVEKSFKLFELTFSIPPKTPSAFDMLCDAFERIGSQPSPENDEIVRQDKDEHGDKPE